MSHSTTAATVPVPVETLQRVAESLMLVARSADVNRCLIADLLGEELPVDVSVLAEQLQPSASPPAGVADFVSYRARRLAVS
ncbi:hypothetical protein ACGFNP_25015 [Nonomuraea sp. NPDC049269]|uniref:hypothetical protein n=1 Tax=Nonomuraea sp. NPDC049269 TaxID=3364349 RepID=UPI00371EFA9D